MQPFPLMITDEDLVPLQENTACYVISIRTSSECLFPPRYSRSGDTTPGVDHGGLAGAAVPPAAGSPKAAQKGCVRTGGELGMSLAATTAVTQWKCLSVEPPGTWLRITLVSKEEIAREKRKHSSPARDYGGDACKCPSMCLGRLMPRGVLGVGMMMTHLLLITFGKRVWDNIDSSL